MVTHNIYAANSLEQANALLNKGNEYAYHHDFENAITIYTQLAAMYPDSSVIQYNLGYALNELTLYQESADALKKACALKPTPDHYVAYATAQIALGNYTDGWQSYEYRWQLPDKKNISMPCPRWDGSTPLKDKRILLLSEGALGDCIQFIRYAQVIKQRGAYVVVQVPSALKLVCSMCPYIDEVVTPNCPLPKIDYYTSLMSLPALLGTTRTTVPVNIPYLGIDQTLIDYWQPHFLQGNTLKIGVCWQADPANDLNRPPMARRSILPDTFAPFAKLPETTLYSLQHDQNAPSFMHTFGEPLDTTHGRFMDTMAIMYHLDLIITVDTAIAHLAGALGIATWLILPFKADWRWMEQCNTSPWYPSMTLFRASKNESWESLLSSMADTLSLTIAGLPRN